MEDNASLRVSSGRTIRSRKAVGIVDVVEERDANETFSGSWIPVISEDSQRLYWGKALHIGQQTLFVSTSQTCQSVDRCNQIVMGTRKPSTRTSSERRRIGLRGRRAN